MNQVLRELVELLDLEALERNLFRGLSRDLGGHSVFGGQVVSQALVAASRTVDATRAPHSLHAYFLRPGDMTHPIIYEVDRVRDGKSFATRRVQAIQHGEVILSMITSFHRSEDGFEHAFEMPDVAPPDKLPDEHELRVALVRQSHSVPETSREACLRPLPIEIRHIRPLDPAKANVPREPMQSVWLRAAGKLPDDPVLHACILAYASDFHLIGTALRAHGHFGFSGEVQVASLDHALWFHRPLRIDDWLLYAMDSPSAHGSRGFARGLFYDREGRLVASAAQEGLVRRRPQQA